MEKAGGWRFGGRAEKKRHRGIRHDFVHVVVYDHPRLAYAEVHPDQRADTVAAFKTRAIAFYADHGTAVKRILTDNAMSYASRAQLALLDAAGVARSPTRPYRPQTNGKAERFIRLLINAWAYRNPTRTARSASRRSSLDPEPLRTYCRAADMRRQDGGFNP